MSSRDKDTKLLQDMLKVFYKKGASAPIPPRNELVVSRDLERELGAESPLHRRLRALKELSEKALVIRMPELAVKTLWTCSRDLLDDPNTESRHAVLTFLCCVAEGQGDDLLIMRTIFFHYLKDTHSTHAPEDAQLRFRLLYNLTNTGKNITCFEEQIGGFLLEWLPQLQAPAQIIEFLQLIINVVKFNATYLDEDIVHGIVNNACYLCEYSPEAGVVTAALSLLEAVVSYSLLPRGALPCFAAALCRTVNLERYCQPSWKLMRSVLGADIGHATLQELVRTLRGEEGGGDAGLVRGAVFYINMALWGPRRVHALQVSHLAVLPAMLQALEINQPVVTYEVALALQSLVSRASHELYEPAWDVLLQLLGVVLQQDKSFDPPNELIHTCAHAIVTSLEQLQDAGQYSGDPDQLLDLIDSVGHDRPESSAMRLVTARAASLSACGREGVAGALALAERYLRRDARLALRLHTLQAIVGFVRRERLVFGEEVVERVGVPVLGWCAPDAAVAVRAAAARAATDLAATAADATTDLIDLLEKILNRPFEMYVGEVAVPLGADVSDCALAAAGLLQLLHRRLPGPPSPAHAARALLVLLDHLDLHYKRPAILLHHPDVRLQILEMVFGLRANAFNCVGFCYDASGAMVSGAAAARLRPLCSPLLLCEPLSARAQPAPPPKELPPGACVVGAGRAARVLVAALTREVEWRVLSAVLRALPPLLHARALALGRRPQDLDLLASTLCSMVSDRSLYFPECVRVSGPGSGARLGVSEFHSAVLPALAALAPHHSCLEPQTQQRIVRCLLKYGMVLRTPQPYINALTVFTLEMRETMVKMLPEVLLDLSKISDTKPIASPMLEFLSTLTRLPKVFASFVEDQYMSVFAILLPYTNPSRYNHYVVSLAHHVIAAWFLKCRLSYRRNFVRFIIHGLHNYIILPFEEQLHCKSNSFQQPAANEDSSNRQRSSSLGSKAVSRVPMGRHPGPGSGSASASAAFHVELTETCVDLLARYTSTPCSVKPQRSDLAEFLFTGGQSMTWLVGHKLITITTSGCLQNSIKQGLCDRCAVLCRQHTDGLSAASRGGDGLSPAPSTGPSPNAQAGASEEGAPPLSAATPSPAPEVRRYSKHSLQHSRSTDTSGSSLSMSELMPPASAPASRQNSSENSKASDPLADALNQFTQRFERISKEVDTEDASWSRVGGLAAAGACPCWCGRWAEVAVRAPTGDVAFVVRAQNHLAHDFTQPHALAELAALIAPEPLPQGLDEEVRSRSGSASSGQAPPPPDLHKSSSDTVVASEKKPPHAASHCIVPPQPHRMSTQPINIPSSPQRQSSSSTNDDEDMLLIVPEGKSRHPVRRSNSSPEMSSSWKESPQGARPPPPDPEEMILLPGVEPTSASACLHASKKAAKKSDMRVSCEAIPEEMSGTSPHAPPSTAPPPPPHLMTYNSDPGTVEAVAGQPSESHHQLQKTASDSTVTSGHRPPPHLAPPMGAGSGSGPSERDDLPPLSRSKRSHTISVMSPTRRHRENITPRSSVPSVSSSSGGGGGSGGGGAFGGGLTPAFVFLQLYHNMSTYPVTPPVPGEAPAALSPLAERPLRVSGAQHERTVKNLDLVPPVETYKVGVLYVGPGQQDNEVLILKNEYGSVRYAEFLCALGTLVPLQGEEHPQLFLNLETGGKDGLYTYVWHDDIMQVLFHVATAMPAAQRDPTCNEKRKYIGNDYVSIVYNDSGADFNIHTIKGQFNFCIVVVEPYEHGLNRVFIKSKDELIRSKFLAHLDTQVVSDANVALLARQLALHAALASQISQSLKVGGAPYASNSLERLRMIKRLRRRLEGERLAAAARPAPYHPPATDLALRVAIDDFNAYT